MRELSLNIMDVTQNSISAKASLISLGVEEDTQHHTLAISIKDNGTGMTQEQVEQVSSPFYTSRTTRPVGLGVPLFKMASEMTGGSFSIQSQPGRGTEVHAQLCTDHIDMTPLGDIGETVLLLIVCNPDIDFVYTRSRDSRTFTLDTRELREVLGEEVPLNSPDVASWMREFLWEKQGELDAPGDSG